MEAWSRLRTSYSSLPMTTSPSSSSTPSSSAPHLLFDLADELWFYSSVVPLPSLSDLPCLPALFSPPPPDPSTLLAQCMITHLTFSGRHNPPSDSEHQNWGFPNSQAHHPDTQENYVNTFCTDKEDVCCEYNETAYGGYSSLSDRDEDFDWGDDEEAYHYYSAPSDWDDEDAYIGYHVPCDYEDERLKAEVLPAGCARLLAKVEPVDDISQIYDVGVVLIDQNVKRTQEVSYPLGDKVTLPVSGLPQIRLPLLNEQGDMKENIKVWAHAVASALPWKAAAQARSLL